MNNSAVTWNNTWHLIKSDQKRFGKNIGVRGLYRLISSTSFAVTFWYRVGHYLLLRGGVKKLLFLPLVRFIHFRNSLKTGIQLDLKTEVGESLLFGHFSDIVINSHTIIGNNVTIANGVTIGWNPSKSNLSPIIGDNCVILAGSKIIGPVVVGKNSVIGVNSVVTKSLPEGSVFAGGKILNNQGLEYVKHYSRLHFE